MIDNWSTGRAVRRLDFTNVAHEFGALDKLVDILVHMRRERRVGAAVATLVVRVLPCENL